MWRDASDIGMRWDDASKIAQGPEDYGDLIVSVGFVVRETDDWLVMSAMWRGQHDQGACSFMIPKACIVRRIVVRRPVGYDWKVSP